MKCPIINPIRFYSITAPDWQTTWPNSENMQQRVKYFEGIYPGQFYKDFIEGENIKLQFQSDVLEPLQIWKWDEITNTFTLNTSIIPVYITPPGWIGENTIYFDFALTVGVYYLKFADGYTSDKIAVHSDLSIKKKLIRINFYNSENDYGAIFENSDTIVFSPVTFFTGNIIASPLENVISAFDSDRGDLVKLKSTPRRIQNLTLCDVHNSYSDHINMIFSCDYININGLEYQNSEPPTIAEKENSDIIDLNIKLIMKNNSYFYQNL